MYHFKPCLRLFLFFLTVYLTFYAYCGISQLWTEVGGTSNTLHLFELPLILILAVLANFQPLQKTSVLNRYTFFAILPLLGLYIFHDFFYSYYQRAPQLSDISNYPALFEISLPLAIMGFVYVFLIFGLPLIFLLQIFFISSWTRRCFLSLQMATLLSVLILLSSPHIYHYQNQNLIFEEWSITKNIRANGRITTFFHSSNKRKKTLTRLVSEPSMDLSQYLFTKRPLNTPDIHIIVLESFIHPQFIKKIRFNFSPLHPMLRPYLNGEKDFSLVQSPVFGGGTAQSEFELLTGIPALSLIESIEFNYFEGSKTPSFVNRLEQFGYFTMGAIGTKPKFYNSQIAYKGLGFREITYVNQGYFTNNSEDEYIFDGDLFNANLEHLERVTSHHGPIFNYIVGMYGHLPYERNLNKRPDVISTNGKNDSLNRITNQFYYRTKALATFIEALQQRDREAIILVVSDHIPPIISSTVHYSYGKKTNIGLLLNNYQPIDITGKKYYELPHIIWNLMHNQPHPTETTTLPINKYKKELYFSFGRHAMGIHQQQ